MVDISVFSTDSFKVLNRISFKAKDMSEALDFVEVLNSHSDDELTFIIQKRGAGE